jgi:AraC-like DNA-binding protein
MPSILAYGRERTYSGRKTAEFAHDHHQLLVAADGAFSIRHQSGAWTVPKARGVWIPAGFRHQLQPLPAARVTGIYVRCEGVRGVRSTCAVLEVAPLTRAIADHLCAAGRLREDDPASKRLFGVLLDQLPLQRELALFVPSLEAELTQKVAAALEADPTDTPRIRDLAAGLGVSGRTIERAFVADAAMTIGEWRQRSRVCRSIELLAGGAAVKDVALEVGYETPSAFVAAFKKYVGTTPGKLS